MSEDFLLQLAELGARLESELVAKTRPGHSVQLKRSGLASAAIERQDRVRLRPLAQRVARGQRQRLRQQFSMVAERQLRLDSLL